MVHAGDAATANDRSVTVTPPDAAPSNGMSPLDIFSPEYLDNPRPVYDHLRSTSPLVWSELPPPGCWIVTSHAAASDVLRDPRFGKSGYWDQVAADRGGENSALTVIRRWMSQLDAPDHTRVRRAFGRTFLPRQVDLMRPRVERVVDDLLDGLLAAPEPEFDFMAAFAFPLPAIVICEVLGIPPSDREAFKLWSVDLARIFDVTVEHESLRRSEDAVTKFRDYFTGLIARNDRSGDDLLTSLIRACEEDGAISEAELTANLTLLVWAGHETTMNLLGNGLFTLLRQRERYVRLVANPDTAPDIVEEVLRYEGPLRTTSRFAREDVHVHGTEVRSGQMLVVLPQAANADPAVFSDPATFDPSRADNRLHLAFGAGIHFCLGAPLARLEGDVAFRKLARRLPELELAGKPDWGVNLFLRGLESLPVRRGRPEQVAR
jgi:cytochrome P450